MLILFFDVSRAHSNLCGDKVVKMIAIRFGVLRVKLSEQHPLYKLCISVNVRSVNVKSWTFY